MYPYVTIFRYQLASYGIIAVLGILAAYTYAHFTNKKGAAGEIPGDDLFNLFLMMLVGALVGSKLLYILTSIPGLFRNRAAVIAEPRLLLDFLMSGGLVFYGGFIGGTVAAIWYCRRYKLNFAETAGIITPAIPLFHTFGRIGCFLGGCCWGVEVSWGIEFHNSIAAPNGVSLMPVQLFEAAGNFLLFLLSAFLSRTLTRKRLVLPIYILCYSAMRFILEFFRGDVSRGIMLLSTSQWIALALAIITILILLHTARNSAIHRQPKH